MKIGRILPNTYFSKQKRTTRNTNPYSTTADDSKRNMSVKEKAKRSGLLAMAIAMGLPVVISADKQSETTQQNNNITDVNPEETNTSGDSLETISAEIDALENAADSDKISLSDISFDSLPVSELYLTGTPEVIELTPNKECPVNENGSIIVTVTNEESDEINEGTNLDEIINKVYSDVLDKYEDEEKTAVYNKIIDETIQSNPSLSEYVNDKLGHDISSYEDIASLNLYNENTGIKLLTMPTSVVYQAQGEKTENSGFSFSKDSYYPKNETASVIDDSDNLLEGEYSSISDLIYSEYGEDISDEAYRDILYAVVNSPANASEFEYVLDEMNINDVITTASITDFNRTLDENTSGMLIGLSLPGVTTLRTTSNRANTSSDDKTSIIYQISPAAVTDGGNDRTITLTDKTGDMTAGDVYTLKDVLQYYTSPDGNGRFANVVDGELVLNDDVNCVNEFVINILPQVVYGNLDIFTAEYTDESGTYKYGVFDVNDDYDTEGKSLEEIIQNSTINTERLMNYSFVDEDGISKFEDGVTLNLPQFNYRINESKKTTVTKKSCPPVQPAPPKEPEIKPEPEVTPSEPSEEPAEPDKKPDPTKPTFKPTEPTSSTHPTHSSGGHSSVEPTSSTHPTHSSGGHSSHSHVEPTIPTHTPNPTHRPDPKPTEPTHTPNPTHKPDPKPTEPTHTPNPTHRPDPKPTEPTDNTRPTRPTDNPDPKPTAPTDNTRPTRPTDNPDPKPTAPTDNTRPTRPTDNPDPKPPVPTKPEEPTTDPTVKPTDGGEEVDPVDPTDVDPTSPTGNTEPTTPTANTDPTTPTDDCDDDADVDEYSDEENPTVNPADDDSSSDVNPSDDNNPTTDPTENTDPTTPSGSTEPETPTENPSEDCSDNPDADEYSDEESPSVNPSDDDSSSDVNPSDDNNPTTDPTENTDPTTPSGSTEPETPTENPSEGCDDEADVDEYIDEENPSGSTDDYTDDSYVTDDSDFYDDASGDTENYEEESGNNDVAEDDSQSYDDYCDEQADTEEYVDEIAPSFVSYTSSTNGDQTNSSVVTANVENSSSPQSLAGRFTSFLVNKFASNNSNNAQTTDDENISYYV